MSIQKIQFAHDSRELIQTLRDISDLELLTYENRTVGYCIYKKFRHGIVYYKDGIPYGYCIWRVKLRTPMITRPYRTAHILGIFVRTPTPDFYKMVINDVYSFCIVNNVPNMSLCAVHKEFNAFCYANNFTLKPADKATIFRPIVQVLQRKENLVIEDPFLDGFRIHTLFEDL